MCSDAPDTSGINAAALANSEIAKEALAFYKDIYASDIRPAQQYQQELASLLTEDYLDTSQQQKDFAAEQKAYYRDTFQPLERQVVRDATEYDSEENVARRSGMAAANVNQQFSNAAGQRARMLGRYGLNPNSSAFASQSSKDAIAQAAAASGAATGAAFDTKDKAIALRGGAANFGRNMPNTASNYFAGSNSSNAAAFGTGQQAMQNIGQNAAVMGQGFGLGIQGNQSAGGMYGQVANMQAQQSAAEGQALGSLAGAGMMAFAV